MPSRYPVDFPSTSWTVIRNAQDRTSPECVAAMNRWMSAYWKPVFYFLRAKRIGRQRAEDLTQEFFLQCFERDWIDPTNVDSRNDLAATQSDLGYLDAQRGDFSAALAHYERALEIHQALANQRPAEKQRQLKVATLYLNIGEVEKETSHNDDARRHFERALAVQRPLAADDPDDVERATSLAYTLLAVANLEKSLGRSDAARMSLDEALQIRRRLARDDPIKHERRNELAWCLSSIASLDVSTGDFPAAAAKYTEARALWRELCLENPDVPEYASALADTLSAVADLEKSLGRSDAARMSLDEALQIRRRLMRGNPIEREYRDELAWCLSSTASLDVSTASTAHFARRIYGCLSSTASLDVSTGNCRAATTNYAEALALWRQLCVENPDVSEYAGCVVSASRELGSLQRQSGHLEEAVASYDEARMVREKLTADTLSPTDPSELADTCAQLGDLLAALGRAEEAAQRYRQAFETLAAWVESHPDALNYRRVQTDVCRKLCELYRVMKKPAEAVDAALRWQRLWPNDPRELYHTAQALALCVPLVGPADSALPAGEESEGQRYADLAIEALGSAVRAGFSDFQRAKSDPDLRAIYGQQAFQKIVGEGQSDTTDSTSNTDRPNQSEAQDVSVGAREP